MRIARYVAVLLFVLPSFPIRAQAPPPTSTHQLAAVQVTGTKRYTQADVGRVSGLVVGQPVTVEQIKSSAERLGMSGLFKSVNFRYLTSQCSGRVRAVGAAGEMAEISANNGTAPAALSRRRIDVILGHRIERR